MYDDAKELNTCNDTEFLWPQKHEYSGIMIIPTLLSRL